MREPVTTISWSSLLGGVFWAWAWALAVVAHAIAQMQVAVEAIDFWMLAFMLGSPFTGFERERGAIPSAKPNLGLRRVLGKH